MSTLQATELRDSRRLKRTRRGLQGTRVYKVNTGDIDTAVFGNNGGPVQGLPLLGDVWDTINAPYCVVVEIEPERDGGNDTDPVNNTNGWTLVRVRYETIMGGDLPPPSSGVSFARLTPSVTQVQAIYGIDPDTWSIPPGEPQLEDGQGAGRDVGVIAYEVFRPLSPAAFAALDIQGLVLLHTRQGVNDAAATLPPFLNSNVRHTFSRDQLRFNGFSLDDPDDTGWRFLRYSLAAAVDHRVRWTAQAEGGEASATEYIRHIYPRMSFAGLW